MPLHFRRRLRSGTLSALVVMSLGPAALAQRSGDTPSYRTRGDSATYEVAFDDDTLLDPGTSAYGEYLKVRGRAPHAGLLRPRTSFVAELLKSVQGL